MTTILPPLFSEVEYKDDDNKPDEVVQHTGAMIALRPRQDHIDRLALDDGEAPEELHTTILFLGKAADYSYDTRARIINAMREVAKGHRFVTGNGFGVNSWNANGESPCIVLGVGGEEMVSIYNAIVGALQGFDLLQVPKQHEPWTPHVTLKYTDDFSEVSDLVDLQGEIVYDAIRVAFGGIVDDIPLQPAVSSNDGYAGGNRYENVPQGGMKTARVQLSETALFELEEKVVRRVRTAAGAKRFGQPIGSVIVRDGSSPLRHVKAEDNDYDGYQKYSVRDKPFWTRKEGSQYVAYDENDRAINYADTEEALLKNFDDIMESGKDAPKHAKYQNLSMEDSEYDGYEKYSAKDGTVLYRNTSDDKWYDENDNLMSRSDVARINNGGKSEHQERMAGTPYGFKKAESEYDGYDKFTGRNGIAVYRDQKDGKFYDENDKPIRDVSKFAEYQNVSTGKAVSREEAGEIMHGSGKKPEAKPNKPANRHEAMRRAMDEDRAEATAKRRAALNNEESTESEEEVSPGRQALRDAVAAKRRNGNQSEAARAERRAAQQEPEKPSQGAQQPAQRAEDDIRNDLPAAPTHPDELDAVLDKVKASKGKKVPADVIKEMRDIAFRQRDTRNRRKLMLYAQNLAEIKVFDALCEMDPWLRATALEVKLITPGGRVGTDATLNRSRRRNWVENSPMKRLPKYIRIVANGLLKNGHSVSRAIALAVAAVKRWARGGDNVRPAVQAAAGKAVAEWEALKASA